MSDTYYGSEGIVSCFEENVCLWGRCTLYFLKSCVHLKRLQKIEDSECDTTCVLAKVERRKCDLVLLNEAVRSSVTCICRNVQDLVDYSSCFGASTGEHHVA